MAQRCESAKLVERYINAYPVVIFSRKDCPYCRNAKQLIKKEGMNILDFSIDMAVIQIDELVSKGESAQDYLYSVTGQRTVPNIFINGNHVGGNADVQELSNDNYLQQMIQDSKTDSERSNSERKNI